MSERDPETTSKIMSSIGSKNTKPEKLLGSAMWELGLRYRKHGSNLPGSPDFYFKGAKIAVFCDGDFWHGNNWRLRGFDSLEEELNSYSDFWANKIRNNIERDERNNKELREMGWTVMRFWGSEIKKDAVSCAKEVKRIYKEEK
ncbi:MAG TPA: very short patch repair endonuclease [Balneolaceae bacterium]